MRGVGVFRENGRVFVSNYETSLDTKGRVSVPAAFRHALEGGMRIFLWPSSDGAPCLEGGGEALMTSYQQTLLRMPPNSPARKSLMSRIVTRAADLKMDDTGRIKIPAKHLQLAGIEKDLIFAGALDRFFVWEPERYAEHIRQMDTVLDDSQNEFAEPYQAAVDAGGIAGIRGGPAE